MRLPDPATMFCLRRAHRLIACGLIASAVFALSGCESIGYYAHVSSGQLSLLGKREPVDDVIANLAGNTDPEAVALSEPGGPLLWWPRSQHGRHPLRRRWFWQLHKLLANRLPRQNGKPARC